MQAVKDTVASGVAAVQETARDIYTGFTWDKRSMCDLTNWTIVVVGATDGVGFESAKAFAEHNAHVVLVGRSADKGEKAKADIESVKGPKAKVELMMCDVSSFKSIRSFAKAYKERGYPLHVLLNNAALQSPKDQRGAKTEEGFEITLGVNHFGLVYLTLLLLDVMKKTSAAKPPPPAVRMVWVTSLGSQLVNPPLLGATTKSPGIDVMPWDDLKCEKYGESDWWQYSRSKLLNILMAKEFAVRLRGSGIQSFVAHPGLSVTDHFGKSDSENKLSSRIVEAYANSPIGQSAERGAIPLEYACTAEALEGKTGTYIGSPELGMVNLMQAHEQEPNAPLGRDPDAWKKAYEETMRIIEEVTGEPWTKQAPGPAPKTEE